MSVKIQNKVEMGLVPGSWAWMKHQLENAEVFYSVEKNLIPCFYARFPDVLGRYRVFSPVRVLSSDVCGYFKTGGSFFTSPLHSADPSESAFPYLSSPARQLLKDWLEDSAVFFRSECE